MNDTQIDIPKSAVGDWLIDRQSLHVYAGTVNVVFLGRALPLILDSP